ncbi:AfsR/SARP family transcriptional regulator [Arthrobacter sp.]|uniref:AfsR/SARP family transcriptional regulator n=1 Tax=Arthrobacter sp. TaxID=1667 RepID=UPI003A8FE01F
MLPPAERRPTGQYRLQVLGGWHLTAGGLPCPVPLRSQRLIALLAVAGPLPRPVIGGRLWPEGTEDRALDSVRVAIHHVCRDLPGLLSRHEASVALSTEVAVDLDLARAALSEDTMPESRPGILDDPELLPGWYEEWVLAAQDRLRTQRLRSHTGRAQRLLDTGDLRGAVEWASRSLDLDPLDEWSLEVLVRAHCRLGSVGAARRAITVLRGGLQREFGQFSSPLLEQLERLATHPPVPGTPVPAGEPAVGRADGIHPGGR